MYLHNKYTTWYNSIISAAQLRTLPETTYTEKHHIIPKSLGGSNSKDNLVRLTAREHFVCHWLLTKMVSGSAIYKMRYAFWAIAMLISRTKKYKMTSNTYAIAKKAFSDQMSNRQAGIAKSEAHKQKIAASNKGKSKSSEHCANIKQNHHDCRGSNNSAAKTWKITSPTGEEYHVIGQLKLFCKEHNISACTLRKIANGIIPTKHSVCYNWRCEVRSTTL